MERTFTGTVAARVQSNLGFRISGKIIERLVDTGQIDPGRHPALSDRPTDYDHAITAQLGNVAAAKARVIQTAADEKRYRRLLPRAPFDLGLRCGQGRGGQRSRPAVDAAAGAAKVAQDERRYSTLVADADGTVVETLAEPGQVVSTGQTVVKLAHAGRAKPPINLPETIRPADRIGGAGHRSTAATRRWPAHLRQLSDAADPVTRTYDARYVLEGDAARAPLGPPSPFCLTE